MPCTFNEACFEPQDEPVRHKLNCLNCHYCHPDNGNCTAVGGFCTAVQAAHCPLIPELLERAEAAEARAAKAEKERDAAIEDLRACYTSPCDTCKHASAPPNGAKWIVYFANGRAAGVVTAPLAIANGSGAGHRRNKNETGSSLRGLCPL